MGKEKRREGKWQEALQNNLCFKNSRRNQLGALNFEPQAPSGETAVTLEGDSKGSSLKKGKELETPFKGINIASNPKI